jgi:hypothetical protein
MSGRGLLRRPALRLALSLAGAVPCAPALLAQCELPAELPGPAGNVDAETQRLRRILDSCERRRHEQDEQVFFTWGHGEKLRWLQEEPQLESCAYNREREVVRNHYALTAAHLDADEALLWLVGSMLARPESRDLWTLRHHPWQESFPAIPPARVDRARDIAMIERAYPGFLDALETHPQDRREDLEDRLDEAAERRQAIEESERLRDAIGALQRRLEEEEPTPAQARAIRAEIAGHGRTLEELAGVLAETRGLNGLEDARTRGELVGLDLVVEGQPFAGSSAHGYGVYLATDPLAFVAHFSSPEHGGLVCDFRGGRAPTLEVVDWTHPADLETLRRHPGDGGDGAALGVIVPPGQGLEVGGYNHFVHPTAFDRASHARLLAVRRDASTVLWVDRCAIDYRAPACRGFRVTDLTCAQAQALDAKEAQVLLMRAYFLRTDPGRVFLGALNEECGLEMTWY